MCVSICILVSFIVFHCTSCIASFAYSVYLSVCMSPVYVYGPCYLILNKMMMMMMKKNENSIGTLELEVWMQVPYTTF